MKKIFLCSALFYSQVLFAQINLVPNPSFEDTVSCPTTANQIDKALGWHASRESPDYFNECDFITGNTSVPSNFNGYQYANSGVAYAGFISYGLTAPNVREYFTCQLITPMIIGKQYAISYYVSWAAGSPGKRIATNNLGILFSSINFTLTNPPAIQNFCQFKSDSIITDSLDWVLISGSIVADSNYSFLTVGNFYTDSNTDTLMLNTPSTYAYYYIDDIVVIEDTTSSIANIFLNKKLTTYPNPVIEHLNIISEFERIDKIEIFYLNRLVHLIPDINKQEARVFMLDFHPGVYIFKITDNKNNQFNHKIIKL